MSKADKKQRHKAKREAKRLANRRRESISPVKRLAEGRGELECWMSRGFEEEMGQEQIFVYKQARGLASRVTALFNGRMSRLLSRVMRRTRIRRRITTLMNRSITMTTNRCWPIYPKRN